MQPVAEPCQKCMPQARTERSVSQQTALARYLELFKRGLAPNMCQRHDGAFYVCYADEAA